MDPFSLSPELLLILSVVAFIAGFIDAIAGGGGLITVPALLTAGVPPHLVLGTNKLSATFGSATASFAYYRKKLFLPKLWWPNLIATAIGAVIGAVIAHNLSASFLEKFLPIIVFSCGLYFLFSKTPNKVMAENAVIKKPRQWPQGFTLGFYDGVAGPGTGAFWMVSTLLMYPVDLLRASGVARTMNFVSNGMALAVFIAYNQVAWLLGLCMGLALMMGAYLGANSAIKGGSKLIRPIFICVVMAITIRLVWKGWFGGS